MNRKSLAFAAVLSLTGFAAQAESPDASGQFAATSATKMSQVSRAEVQADYVRSRDAVRAMTSEDSGSNATMTRPAQRADAQVAGQPVNAR